MGKSNVAVKQWLRDKERFADLFNGMIFQGKQIILPHELEEIDSESSIILTDKNYTEKGVQKYRDITMLWKSKVEFSVLACENQNKVHYAMPVRMMLYDSMSYTEQIRQIWKNEKRHKKITNEEFLSKFRKKDKIYPVISMVFYYGLTPWDGSVDLYGMFRNSNIFQNETLKSYIPNYKINLIDAGNVVEIEKFESDLQVVFGMLKCRQQKEALQVYINQNAEYFRKVDRETYQAIRELLHSEKELRKVSRNEEEEEDMCKALEDLYNDGVVAGKETGIKALIKTCREFQVPEQEILTRIQQEFSIGKEKAMEYLKA